MQQQNSTTLIEQATKWITALEEFLFVQIASYESRQKSLWKPDLQLFSTFSMPTTIHPQEIKDT